MVPAAAAQIANRKAGDQNGGSDRQQPRARSICNAFRQAQERAKICRRLTPALEDTPSAHDIENILTQQHEEDARKNEDRDTYDVMHTQQTPKPVAWMREFRRTSISAAT
jgi:hypothetical protein